MERKLQYLTMENLKGPGCVCLIVGASQYHHANNPSYLWKVSTVIILQPVGQIPVLVNICY